MTLLPCPNPECGAECTADTGSFSAHWQVFCNRNCGYHGPWGATDAEAIALHNAMPREEPWIPVTERLPLVNQWVELQSINIGQKPVLRLVVPSVSEWSPRNDIDEKAIRCDYIKWRPYREPRRP